MPDSTIAEELAKANTSLREAGVPEPGLDASLLLANVLGRDRTFLIVNPHFNLTENQVADFRKFIERRSTGEPIQYITGRQWFFNLEFEVEPGVLIPRPETELLVEKALTLIGPDRTVEICDVGVGTGCILISIIHELPLARGLGLDISPRALDLARRNSERLGTNGQIEFRRSDIFSRIEPEERFDLIVSNPPYIPEGDHDSLQREVREHEPAEALVSGPDGLNMIRRLLQESAGFLKPGGHFLFEIGFDQSEAVRAAVAENSWTLIEIISDLQGIPRIVVLRNR